MACLGPARVLRQALRWRLGGGLRWWEWTTGEACEPPECPNQDMQVGLPCDGSLFTGPCPSYDGCENASPVWCVEGVWQGAGDRMTTAASGGGGGTSGTGVGFDQPDLARVERVLLSSGDHRCGSAKPARHCSAFL